jgi:hypothetical protein
MYTIITGMSQSYYDHIGQAMIESWLKFWPADTKLIVYSEDNLEFLNNDRIKVVPLDSLGEQYIKFQTAQHQKNKLDNRMKTYAKKAFPIMHHLQETRGKLIWVDADVITLNNITTEWIDSLIDQGSFSAHLGVPQAEYYSVETGFFIIDLENKHRSEFLSKYQNIYYNLDFSNMKKPYDGDTFGRIVTEMKSIADFKYTELSPDIGIKSPFNIVFEDKMQHYKAKRKLNFN